MNCPKCGSMNNDGVRFCTSCGVEMSTAAAPPVVNANTQPYTPAPETQQYTPAPETQQYTPNYNAPTANNPPAGAPKGSTYLIWSILSTLFCCLPFGVAGIIFAAKIDALVAQGDIMGAEEAAKKAKLFTIIAAVGGGVIMIAYFALIVLGGLSMEGML